MTMAKTKKPEQSRAECHSWVVDEKTGDRKAVKNATHVWEYDRLVPLKGRPDKVRLAERCGLCGAHQESKPKDRALTIQLLREDGHKVPGAGDQQTLIPTEEDDE